MQLTDKKVNTLLFTSTCLLLSLFILSNSIAWLGVIVRGVNFRGQKVKFLSWKTAEGILTKKCQFEQENTKCFLHVLTEFMLCAEKKLLKNVCFCLDVFIAAQRPGIRKNGLNVSKREERNKAIISFPSPPVMKPLFACFVFQPAETLNLLPIESISISKKTHTTARDRRCHIHQQDEKLRLFLFLITIHPSIFHFSWKNAIILHFRAKLVWLYAPYVHLKRISLSDCHFIASRGVVKPFADIFRWAYR